MASRKNKTEEEEEKVQMVPRRKLQSVPDLLANGVNEKGENNMRHFRVSYCENNSHVRICLSIYKDPSQPESWITKTLWMAFLLTLFYLSFELFLKFDKMSREQKGSNSEL